MPFQRTRKQTAQSHSLKHFITTLKTMKLHLPKALFAAVMAACVVPSTWATITTDEAAKTYTVSGTGPSNKSDDNAINPPTGADYTLIFQIENSTNTGDRNFFNANFTANGSVQIGDIGTTADDTKGMVITNGNSGAGSDVVFTGKVTGSGILERTGNPSANSNNITFSGDVTEYIGNIYLGASTSATFTLTFGGKTDAVNAATTSSTAGASGTGNITIATAKNHLVYNYAAGENPVYITNAISESAGVNGSTVTLKGGADYIFKKTVSIDQVNLEAGSLSLEDCDGSGNANVRGAIKVSGGATLIAGGNDKLGWVGGATKSITLLGASESSLATFRLGGRQTMTAELHMDGNAIVTATGTGTGDTQPGLNAFRKNGAIIDVTGTNNKIEAALQTRDSFHITVADEGTLVVSGQVLAVDKGANGYDANANPNGYEVGSVVKLGGGTLTFTNTANTFTKKYFNEAGETVIDGASAFNNGMKISGGKVTLGADITLGSAIELAGGSLDLGSGNTITISDSALGNLDYEYVHGLQTTENGYDTYGKSYYIISGIDDSNLTGTATYKLGEQEITVTNGRYETTGTANSYVVNTGKVSTNDITGVTEFFTYAHEGQEAGTLVLDGKVDDMYPNSVLANTYGNGNIEVGQSTITFSNGMVSNVTGTLIIGEGKTLQVGTGGTNSPDSSIASFSAVHLDGGALKFNTASTSINNLTVSKDSDMVVQDTENSQPTLTLNGTTTLNAALNVTNNDSGKLLIKTLSGNGNLTVDGSGWGHVLNLEILAFDNYTGEITFDGNNITEAGEHLKLGSNWSGKLTVRDYADTGDYQRHLTFVQKISAGGTLTLSNVNGWIDNGTVAADVVLNNEGLKLTNGGSNHTYKFSGKVSGNGNYTISLVNGPDNLGTTFTGDISGWKAANDGSNQMLFTSTAARTFKLTFQDDAAEVNVSDIKTEGSATLAVTMNHSKAATINSNITNEGTALNLTVTNSSEAGTTFNGAVDISALTVSDGTLATFSKSVTTGALTQSGAAVTKLTGTGNITVGGAKISGDGATITRNDDGTNSYSIGNVGFNVNNAKVEVAAAEGNSTISNRLQGVALSNTGTVLLTASNGYNNLTELQALTGDINMTWYNQQQQQGTISNLNIAAQRTVGAYVGHAEQSDMATVKVSGLTAGAGATLNANLILTDSATLAFDGALALGNSTLTLGSGLTLNADTLAAIKNLSGDDTVALFTGVGALTLGEEPFTMGENVLDATSGIDLSKYFTLADAQTPAVLSDEQLSSGYYLGFDANGTLYAGVIPEPTTATLSLLALAALAARRRRK